MDAITHREMRNHSAEVLRRVAAGEILVVTNHGHPVAVLSPAPAADGAGRYEALSQSGELVPARDRRGWAAVAPPGPLPGPSSGELIRQMRGVR